jgi:hypothetical protein
LEPSDETEISEETEMSEKTEDSWMNIDDDFYQRKQFPNCIGSVDGKQSKNAS